MKAVIITGNKYPQEDAGAIRQHATAKILCALGYDVIVLGYGKPTENRVCTYDEIDYVSFRPSSTNTFIRALYRFFFIDRVVHYIKKNIKEIDALFIVDVLPKDFKPIENLASAYKTVLVHDSVEWYSPEEFNNGAKNRSYRNKEYTNQVAVGKGWRVIAISRFLEKHFLTRCDKVVRIPVIMDIKGIVPKLTCENKKTVFVYAGGPGKKDYLNCIIEGFSLLPDDDRKKVELHILGVNKAQIRKQCGVDDALIDSLEGILFIHGRVPHKEAVEYVKNASFTILIRDESLRYAKAGFPTKVVESMAYGTPVICNYSSDLIEYLMDGNNAIIVKNHQPEGVSSSIQSTLLLSEDEYSKMRYNARNTAEFCFDYRKYIKTLHDLLC